MTIPDAHRQLNHLQKDADQDHGDTPGGDDEEGMPGRVGVMLHAARHAHEAQDIQRNKSKVKANQG